MIAVLSPAKTLDYATPFPAVQSSSPRFAEDATNLARHAAKLGRKRLAELMTISDRLADLNDGRYKRFADQPERPALYAFAGDVYTGFEARSLDAPAIDFTQDHVRLLSGLYGLLRPLDVIRPYRLEMGTRWRRGARACTIGGATASPARSPMTSRPRDRAWCSISQARNIGARWRGGCPQVFG